MKKNKRDELDLSPIQELMHNFTYNKGYHIGDLSTLFRKMAIELAKGAFIQYRCDEYMDASVGDYVHALECFTDAMDRIDEVYKEQFINPKTKHQMI